MADKREAILVRLLAVCAGLDDIAATARNATDVAGGTRPALIVQDGSEERNDAPRSENRSRVSRMELNAQVWLFVRAVAADAGPLMSRFRNRLILAVINDSELQTLTGTVGEIRYDGCTVIDPNPETREPRMDLNFAFVYTLAISDLEAI